MRSARRLARCSFRPSLAARASVVAGVGCRAQLVGLTRASMASSPVERGAARAPPPPDRLSILYKLVDKKVIAGALCRHARVVELAATAATQAEALFADDSLVVARLRMDGSMSLTGVACHASGAESEAFMRQSWALLLSAIPILLRRLESDTLLPGIIREEELDFAVHEKTEIFEAKNEPVPPPSVIRAFASTIGYGILLDAMYRGLELLPFPWWPAAQKRSVELFVLQGLDIIPHTAGIAHSSASEDDLVAMMERRINPRHYDPAFCAAVLRKWRSEAVSSVLRARGALQTRIAKSEQNIAEFEARQRDDIAKHGLRDCALPSCSKTEKTVKEFAGCSGCRTVVYCCLDESAALHAPPPPLSQAACNGGTQTAPVAGNSAAALVASEEAAVSRSVTSLVEGHLTQKLLWLMCDIWERLGDGAAMGGGGGERRRGCVPP